MPSRYEPSLNVTEGEPRDQDYRLRDEMIQLRDNTKDEKLREQLKVDIDALERARGIKRKRMTDALQIK